jgi:hypothetical protein
MSFFGRGNMTVSAEATATLVASGRYCVISLATTGTGVLFAGSGTANLGCGVASNSTDPAAVAVDGTSVTITASPVGAAGGVPPASRFTGTTTTLPGSLPVANPFSHLADPVTPNPCSPGTAVNVEPGVTATFNANCYIGMTLKGNVRLNGGTYFIGAGGLDITSQATVTGTGVTFVFLQNSGPVTINGGGNINLTAPTSGTYAGVLMHRHSLAPAVTNTFSGNSGTVLDGAIYMPNQHVTMTGTSDWTATCLRLVTRTVTFTGNSVQMNSCTRPNDNGMIAGFVARLVR